MKAEILSKKSRIDDAMLRNKAPINENDVINEMFDIRDSQQIHDDAGTNFQVEWVVGWVVGWWGVVGCLFAMEVVVEVEWCDHYDRRNHRHLHHYHGHKSFFS